MRPDQTGSLIVDLETQIAQRREYYNAEVNVNNARLSQFPDSLLADLEIAGVRPRQLFAAPAGETADVDVAHALAPAT